MRDAAEAAATESFRPETVSECTMDKLAELGKLAELEELVELAELAELGELLAELVKNVDRADNQNMTPGPVQLLVLQPTPFCNLDCSYCYLPDRNSTARMNWTTLELAVDRVLTSPFVDKTLSVVWHSGEPLVLPIDWYEEAFARIESLNAGRTRIVHHLQTNGVLINDRWIDLFRRNRVGLGLSIDGPARIHDAHRKTRSGAGTHHRVMRAIDLLNNSRLEYHVICVLTSASINAADEMHNFFRDAGIRQVGFNIEEIEGLHTESSLAGAEMIEEYRLFLHRMLELSKIDGTPRIRELTTARSLILDRHYDPLNNQQTTPLRIVSVGVNGEISTFSPELLGNKNPTYGDFIFGNVKTHGLEDVLIDDSFVVIKEEIQFGVNACRRLVRLLHDVWRWRAGQQSIRGGKVRRYGDNVLPTRASGDRRCRSGRPRVRTRIARMSASNTTDTPRAGPPKSKNAQVPPVCPSLFHRRTPCHGSRGSISYRRRGPYCSRCTWFPRPTCFMDSRSAHPGHFRQDYCRKSGSLHP